METIYFVLGMLSIVGAAFVATIVWGVVKITKLLKVIKQQEEWIINNDRNVWENVHRLRDESDRKSDDLYREINKRTEDLDRNINQRVTELQRELDARFNDAASYVDSRVDKMSATLKEQKQVIKG